jgi:hypothetical protein
MITLRRGFFSRQRKHGRFEGIDHQRDDACAVGFKGELRDAEHEVELLEEELAVVDVGRRGLRGDGLGALLPLAGDSQLPTFGPSKTLPMEQVSSSPSPT